MMEQISENNSRQSDRDEGPSLGRMLREAREKHGFSVTDVAGQIKFAPRQIEALEADDFKHLPEEAFLRGFVRSYAKILHLDAQVLLAALPKAKVAEPELMATSLGLSFPKLHPVLGQNLAWLVALSILVVVVLGYSFWSFKTPIANQSKEPTKEQISEQPTAVDAHPINEAVVDELLASKPSKTAPSARVDSMMKSTPVQSGVRAQKTKAAKVAGQTDQTDVVTSHDEPAQSAELRLVFGEQSWTEIKDRNGKIISSQVNLPGSELVLEGVPPFTMLIGHAATAQLFLRGKQVDLTPYINKTSEVAHLKLK